MRRELAARRVLLVALALACAAPGPPASAAGEPAAGPESRAPLLLGAQYTFIEQEQTELDSPYASRLSLRAGGDRQPTNTMAAYTGWAPLTWLQGYFDIEKFMGAGVSGTTGLAGLTNGDVIREGNAGLKKEFYVARLYARFMVPLGAASTHVARAQDQVPGNEALRRLEFKAGRMAVSDDFDRNRYAGSARSEFLNWTLWNNPAWDFAANTRGYTDGFVLGYLSPGWSLKYGIYRMPVVANGQTLETLNRARGENLELTLSPGSVPTVVRLLAYRNTGRMGIYSEALSIAAAAGTLPNIAADDRDGRHKTGVGLNVEQPLADAGDSGLFARLGWNDGRSEDFVFTEVDRVASFGGQLAGARWQRGDDRIGAAFSVEGLSAAHRAYLAAGGMGFLIGDGRLTYGSEEIAELYYRAQWTWQSPSGELRLGLTPDAQYVQNPAYNRDRGPVRFYALRLHLEY